MNDITKAIAKHRSTAQAIIDRAAREEADLRLGAALRECAIGHEALYELLSDRVGQWGHDDLHMKALHGLLCTYQRDPSAIPAELSAVMTELLAAIVLPGFGEE